MCEYQGYEFGAPYPDSMCIDGVLQDADSDYDTTEDNPIPCPVCRTKDAISYWKERFIWGSDCKGSNRQRAKQARSLVRSILHGRLKDGSFHPEHFTNGGKRGT